MRSIVTRVVIGMGIAALVAACGSTPPGEFATVTVSGEVRMPAGPMPAGTLHFRLYNLESLAGVLAHPLQEIEDFESDLPRYSHTFRYPLHMGRGLAVFAWLDTDGDGSFCTPEVRLDPGGLAWTEATPTDQVTLDITLSGNCRAANYFYPPVPVAE